jgi:hypothetical protein
MKVGLVQGDNLSGDGSFVEANAAKQSRIPREQLEQAAQVKQTVRQYLAELEEQNPVEEPVHEQDQVSTTDPPICRKNRYRCPAGQPLNYGGRNLRNRTFAYIGTRKRCGVCSQKAHLHRWSIPLSRHPYG